MHFKLFSLAFWTFVFYIFILILHAGTKLVVFYNTGTTCHHLEYTNIRATVNTGSATVAGFTLVSLIGWRVWNRRRT